MIPGAHSSRAALKKAPSRNCFIKGGKFANRRLTVRAHAGFIARLSPLRYR